MSRRAPLPGASELFRRTSSPEAGSSAQHEGSSAASAVTSTAETAQRSEQAARGQTASGRSGSGRQRHDAKITVYLSGEEVLDLEQTRLTLRGTHGLPVDRGRIVREAVAVLLEDFDQNGEESVLVQRLRGHRTAG